MIDIHTHILPGVDDGSRNIEETKALLQMAWNQGVNKIIATPHFHRHVSIETLKERLEIAREAAFRIHPDFTIELGQEIMYFEDLPEWLSEKNALTMAQSRYVLIEFQPQESYQRLVRAAHDLTAEGYLPIIAHIERYACLRQKGRTAELIEMGAYLQVNASSTLGGMFDSTSRWCRGEISSKRVHFIASDMHNPTSRPPRMGEAFGKAEKYGILLQRQLFGINQNYILKDKILKR